MGIIPLNIPVERKMSDKIKMIIYGDPMIGKTEFASTFPNALFISTDGNVRSIKNPAIIINFKEIHVNEDGSIWHELGWEKFIKVLNALKTDKIYDTIVIDLIDDVYDMLRMSVNQDLHIVNEQKGKFGEAYIRIDDEFSNLKDLLASIDKNVILICHAKDRVDKNGDVTGLVPSLKKSSLKKLVKYVDLISYVEIIRDEYDDVMLDKETKRHFLKLNMVMGESFSSNRWGIQESWVLADYNVLVNKINESQNKKGEI